MNTIFDSQKYMLKHIPKVNNTEKKLRNTQLFILEVSHRQSKNQAYDTVNIYNTKQKGEYV